MTSKKYIVSYTASSKIPITVLRKRVVSNVDTTIIGERFLEYGEIFNDNCLRLLEHFAAPAISDGTPLRLRIADDLLKSPTQGQIWFNTTANCPMVWNGANWDAVASMAHVAGNSGVISHGSQLPLPIDYKTGYLFSYDECYWVVSPHSYSNAAAFMECYTTNDSTVVMRTRNIGSSTLIEGNVNYQIIGIAKV